MSGDAEAVKPGGASRTSARMARPLTATLAFTDSRRPLAEYALDRDPSVARSTWTCNVAGMPAASNRIGRALPWVELWLTMALRVALAAVQSNAAIRPVGPVVADTVEIKGSTCSVSPRSEDVPSIFTWVRPESRSTQAYRSLLLMRPRVTVRSPVASLAIHEADLNPSITMRPRVPEAFIRSRRTWLRESVGLVKGCEPGAPKLSVRCPTVPLSWVEKDPLLRSDARCAVHVVGRPLMVPATVNWDRLMPSVMALMVPDAEYPRSWPPAPLRIVRPRVVGTLERCAQFSVLPAGATRMFTLDVTELALQPRLKEEPCVHPTLKERSSGRLLPVAVYVPR